VSRAALLRVPATLGLLMLAIAAFWAGPAYAQCGEEERGEVAFGRAGELYVGLCGPKQSAAVLRLDRAGKLDSSFAEDGTLGPWPSNSPPHLAVATEGKLLVQMQVGFGRRHHRVVLRRFTATGKLDRSFASGNAVVPTNPHNSAPSGLIRVFSQPGGSSVVAYYGSFDGCFGSFCAERTYFIRMLRYSASGKRVGDQEYYSEYWELDGLAMAPDGGLIVTGDETEYGKGTYLRTKPDLKSRVSKQFEEEETGPSGVVAAGPGDTFYAGGGGQVARYRPGGAIDRSFGERGSVECEAEESYFGELEGTRPGGVLAAGGGGPCELVEYRRDGSLNAGFGTKGSVNLEALGLVPSRYRLESIAVGPGGEIAGVYGSEDHPVLRVVRLSADGRLETGFGKGGVVTLRDFAPA